MFKVTKQILSKKLLQQREKGVNFSTFLGAKWLVSKIILAMFTGFLFLQNDPFYRSIALVGIGYLVGMILAHLRSFIILKRAWPFHQEFIDWEEVEQSVNS